MSGIVPFNALFRLTLTFVLTLSLSGCYLHLMVTQGGYIESGSTHRDCPSGQICKLIIGSTAFSESFTAIPNEGYEFKGWANGDGFLCGAETTDTCTVNGGPAELVHSERNAYIAPIFEKLESDYSYPVVLDGNGDLIDDIDIEQYPYNGVFFADFSLRGSYVQYNFSAQVYQLTMETDMYFAGDTCDPHFAYAAHIPDFSTGWAYSHVRDDVTHMYQGGYVVDEVLVGSTMGFDKVCVDISDQYIGSDARVYGLHYLGVDEHVKPLERYGPPPCWEHNIPSCYEYLP